MQVTSELQVDLDNGGRLRRQRTELLPDGTYLFEDDLKIDGLLSTTVITCVAWLLELYNLSAGELGFMSGGEFIRPGSKAFGVLYPPFSITVPTFKNVTGRLFGLADTKPLRAEYTGDSIVFDLMDEERPTSTFEAFELLKHGTNHQLVPLNPKPSLLTLKTKRLIDNAYLEHLSIANIARHLGVTPEHVSRQFKRDFGLSPSAYLHKLRVADAPLRLARGEEILSVSHDVGYNDLSRFYKQFRKTTATSPGACKTLLRPTHS